MNIQSLARTLGGEASGGKVVAPGPGHSKHDRSLAVWIDPSAPDGLRTHSFAGDDWRVCRDHVMAMLGVAPGYGGRRDFGITRETPAASDNSRAKEEQTKIALRIWDAGEKPILTPAEPYLLGRRIMLDFWLMDGKVIRYHRACPFRRKDGGVAHRPAMVALLRDIGTDEPRGIHRTALKPDGSGKADCPDLVSLKMMLGIAKGAAVKISPDADVTIGLGIAEGIETALTLYAAKWRPIWALGSAGAIETLPVLPGIEALTIFADNDAAGIKAARTCRERWQLAGRECRILAAPVSGTDWNDARAA